MGGLHCTPCRSLSLSRLGASRGTGGGRSVIKHGGRCRLGKEGRTGREGFELGCLCLAAAWGPETEASTGAGGRPRAAVKKEKLARARRGGGGTTTTTTD
jgi:hypothetical protein